MLSCHSISRASVLLPLALALSLTPSVSAQSADLAARSLLLDAQAIGHNVFAVGGSGRILRSADDGRTWKLAATPTLVTLTGTHFVDSLHGWSVGHDALILHTGDGGQTWVKQYQGPDPDAPLLDVLFLDARKGFAVGAYGQFLATTDGGLNWISRRIIKQDRHLNRISVGPAGSLYIAGEQGTLLRSTDDGETWQGIDSPYDGSFCGILPLGPRTLIAYGLRGRIYRSEDNGDEWRMISLVSRALLSTAVRLHDGIIVAAGQARAFLVSRDDGRSFQTWTTGLTTPVAELVETSDGRLLAFGEAGVTELPRP